MRVTPTIEARNFLQNINQTKARLDLAQEAIASGKKVNHLSDDPYAASQASQITAQSSGNDQFIANNDQLRSRFELLDTTLQSLIQSIDGAKVLAAQALSGTTTPESRSALANGVEGVKQEGLSDANAQFNGTFVFAGTKTSTVPFIDSGGGVITYQGNNEAIYHRLDRSTVVQSNITGQDLFVGVPSVFTVLDDLKTAIQNNDINTIHARLADLGTISDRINSLDTVIGNHMQLVDEIQSRLKTENLALQTQSSRLTDANLVEAISSFNLATQAVNVSLSSQAKVQQLSLIDFLR